MKTGATVDFSSLLQEYPPTLKYQLKYLRILKKEISFSFLSQIVQEDAGRLVALSLHFQAKMATHVGD